MPARSDSKPVVKAVIVRMEGRVQGVWFRGWMIQEARARGIQGWVRNRRDGSVEALLAGTEAAVEDMIDACWQGPPVARVVAVRTATGADPGEVGFHHLPSR